MPDLLTPLGASLLYHATVVALFAVAGAIFVVALLRSARR